MYLLSVGGLHGSFASWISNTGCSEGTGTLEVISLKLPVGFDMWHFSFQGRRFPDFSRVQLSEDAFLQYIHSSETLTLTLNHTAEHLLEGDIKLFRKYFWDRAFLLQVCVPSFWYVITDTPWEYRQQAYSFGNSVLEGSTSFFFIAKLWTWNWRLCYIGRMKIIA